MMPALQPGRYWLHVLSDGREMRFAEPPENIPALTVDVSRQREQLVEQTYTFNKDGDVVPPPGAGWERRDRRRGTSTAWQRRRSLTPFPQRLNEGDHYVLVVLADGTEERTLPILDERCAGHRPFLRVRIVAADAVRLIEDVITDDEYAEIIEPMQYGDLVVNFCRGYSYRSKPPPGAGWRIHDNSKDRSTVWRRVRPQIAAPVLASDNIIPFEQVR